MKSRSPVRGLMAALSVLLSMSMLAAACGGDDDTTEPADDQPTDDDDGSTGSGDAMSKGPQALFFPIFQPAGDHVAAQAPGVDGLEDTVLLAADALLVDDFLALSQSEGMYLSGPDTRYGSNTNQSTGKNAEEFLMAYEEQFGEPPSAAFWAHAYDATTLLLEAIKAASYVTDDGMLMVDRAGVREYLDGVSGYQGLIGVINCDGFGDCGSQRISIIESIGGAENVEQSKENVVFEYAPQSGDMDDDMSGDMDGDADGDMDDSMGGDDDGMDGDDDGMDGMDDGMDGMDDGMDGDMEMMTHLGDGSMGIVEVADGDAIQIRSLESISGDVAFLGLPNLRGTMLAIQDFGQIHGFDVDLGTPHDDTCSNDGGQAAAQTIVADESVIGVIGTSCSGAAVAAAPLITDANMVIISASNTSPALTSDLAGNAGPNRSVGYYRTAHNDLFQGAAMAHFVYNELDLTTAAAIHDGDPYTQGLAQAFVDAFESLGGTITGVSAVNKEDTDMVPVLTEIAAG